MFCVRFMFCSENEKLSQREVIWQQVENLAKTKIDWMKNSGMAQLQIVFRCLSFCGSLISSDYFVWYSFQMVRIDTILWTMIAVR